MKEGDAVALFYIAHRLFAAHDRALGAYIAQRLAERVGEQAVFLPFCDTDEENLVARIKGERLYKLDRMRLRHIDGMIAVLHGPSLDDGVCMEIGYATALGVPVVVFSTDFQTYGPTPDGPILTFPDPLLEAVTTTIVRQHRLGPPETADGPDHRAVFLNQNLHTIATATEQAVEMLLQTTPVDDVSPPPQVGNGQRSAFIEPSPYIPGDLWHEVADQLHATGWMIHVARRFGDHSDPRRAAQLDWDAFCCADLTVVDVRGPETPPGAALLVGASAATSRPVLAAAPDSWCTFADGREPNWRNLMIQYAVHGRFADINEFAALVATR